MITLNGNVDTTIWVGQANQEYQRTLHQSEEANKERGTDEM